MIRIYSGKLTWFDYASNETIFFVFPNGFEVGKEVYVYTQWTRDGGGRQNSNFFSKGHIDVDNIATDGQRNIGFCYEGYYKFDATLSGDQSTLTFIMRNPLNERSTPNAAVKTKFESDSSDYIIYSGKYNDSPDAVNELFVVVISPDISYKSDIAVLWQWTSHDTITKGPHVTVGKVTYFQQSAAAIKIDFINEAADYKFTASTEGEEITNLQIRISNSAQDLDTKTPQRLILHGRSREV